MQNIVFGGLLLTASSANGVIAWAMELSFFFHTYEILMVNGECQKKAAVFPQSTSIYLSIYLSISCIDIIYLHWLLFFLRLTNTVIDCLSVCLSVCLQSSTATTIWNSTPRTHPWAASQH
jgi:hypothetical protein